VESGSVRVFLCGVVGMIVALCTQFSCLTEEKAVAASPQRNAVSVPSIGCRSDGQLGPQDAPKSTRTSVPISLKAAQDLAYYRSTQQVGILAPRGWYCFGTYGSGGDHLFVSPQPIDTANIFSPGWSGFAGPAIQVSHLFGDTSGRFAVAEVIARVFPAYKAFATGVIETFDLPPSSFTFGPYPKDTLRYKGKTLVDYKTPPEADGLGTYSSLRKNGSPIDGVAILIGESPDLLLLSVRLPPDLTGLTSAIVRQLERDAGASR
jgi:hypothetical protein